MTTQSSNTRTKTAKRNYGDFIQQVATDQGVTKKLTDQEKRQAHNYANMVPQDYYYRLKEYFYA
jgi:hypothetical protein